MNVRDIMTSNVNCCTPDTDLPTVARMMAEGDCGAIPVVDSMDTFRPVGIVTDRDIVIRTLARGENPLELRAGDCMSSWAHTISPNAALDQVLEVIEECQVRRVPVVDENGRCIGIIAQVDIAENAPTSDTAELLREVSQPEHGADWQPARLH